MNDWIHRFEEQWKFARGLTRDLLISFEASDLSFSPGNGVGPLWKHFRHLGRIQENHQRALSTGKIAFDFEGTSYAGGESKNELLAYLNRLDRELHAVLRTLDSSRLIEWPAESVDCFEHLSRMVHHEILHHGMFIVCSQIRGTRMPKSWEAWGIE